DYTVTEMISAAAVCFEDNKTFTLAEISPVESPCAVQIFGHDPSQMSYAAEKLLSRYPKDSFPCAVDINMGCPVRKIVTSGDGSALMKEPRLASEIVKAVSDVTQKYGIPTWVKIRAGWDKNSINAPYFAALMAESGAARITVHGRTREQMYAPSSDNGVIRAVKENLPKDIELIGNGDITCAADAVRMIEETGCDGVAIGRAACGDPWIFREISCINEGVVYTEPPLSEKIELALKLILDVVKLKGETMGIRESRGRAAHFIKGIRGSASVRDALNHAETYEQFAEILRGLVK
ncbi:MAG: tRNA-dihydrouridine synthase, partial [Clostridia bacterium]|nr:tRNA-dihydrouridine synthase [Clostridia bacterium]